MAVVFSEGWTHAEGEPSTCRRSSPPRPRRPAPACWCSTPAPAAGHAEVAAALAALVGAARRRLWITNAYFAPGHRAMKILVDAARRGVDVRLLLPGTTDVPLVRHAGHGYYAELLAAGVRIFEYQPAILHAKSLVADGYASVVGSTNLDFRSFVFNAECNVLVLDRETAGAMERAFEADLEQSHEITRAEWRRRPLLERLGDRLARLLSPVL